jgi:hypothetical protein
MLPAIHMAIIITEIKTGACLLNTLLISLIQAVRVDGNKLKMSL